MGAMAQSFQGLGSPRAPFKSAAQGIGQIGQAGQAMGAAGGMGGGKPGVPGFQAQKPGVGGAVRQLIQNPQVQQQLGAAGQAGAPAPGAPAPAGGAGAPAAPGGQPPQTPGFGPMLRRPLPARGAMGYGQTPAQPQGPVQPAPQFGQGGGLWGGQLPAPGPGDAQLLKTPSAY